MSPPRPTGASNGAPSPYSTDELVTAGDNRSALTAAELVDLLDDPSRRPLMACRHLDEETAPEGYAIVNGVLDDELFVVSLGENCPQSSDLASPGPQF